MKCESVLLIILIKRNIYYIRSWMADVSLVCQLKELQYREVVEKIIVYRINCDFYEIDIYIEMIHSINEK